MAQRKHTPLKEAKKKIPLLYPFYYTKFNFYCKKKIMDLERLRNNFRALMAENEGKEMKGGKAKRRTRQRTISKRIKLSPSPSPSPVKRKSVSKVAKSVLSKRKPKRKLGASKRKSKK